MFELEARRSRNKIGDLCCYCFSPADIQPVDLRLKSFVASDTHLQAAGNHLEAAGTHLKAAGR